MAKDLTAVLLPAGQLADDEIVRVAEERSPAWVRVAPLEAVGLIQVEIHEGAQGLPAEDPALVERLSRGGRAAFVHVNHSAKQALVQAFLDGKAQEGFAGSPGDEFAGKLRDALGKQVTLDELAAADDGSRIGIGIASSHTRALYRGARLIVPPGTPTGANSFSLHDRGDALDDEKDRLAFFAYRPFDAKKVDRDVRALEQYVLEESAVVFAGGDAMSYWDERVLPMFSLSADEPKIEQRDVEELEDCDSLLHALVEVTPFAAPPDGEGHLLAQIADREIAPLAPWAEPGEEYAGAIFRFDAARLLPLVRALDGRKLRTLSERMERAWYRAARPGQPEGDAFDTFKRALAEEGEKDIDRFLRDFTELRIVLELAAANSLHTAMFFYSGK
jgi:hypothetical protein